MYHNPQYISRCALQLATFHLVLGQYPTLSFRVFGMSDVLFSYVSILGFVPHDRHEPSSVMGAWPRVTRPVTVLGYHGAGWFRADSVTVAFTPDAVDQTDF
jgi:hypothetical protein